MFTVKSQLIVYIFTVKSQLIVYMFSQVFVCQKLTTGRCFSPGTPVSSTNKTDSHDITEILLEVALSTKKTQINWDFTVDICIFHYALLNETWLWTYTLSILHYQLRFDCGHIHYQLRLDWTYTLSTETWLWKYTLSTETWLWTSHNVISSTPRLSEIRTLNISGDRNWLHR
jgi:hypothetical protein